MGIVIVSGSKLLPVGRMCHFHMDKSRSPDRLQIAFRELDGVVAQLVERLVRNEKVAGSIPVGSTIFNEYAIDWPK